MFNQVAVFQSPKALAGEEDWGRPTSSMRRSTAPASRSSQGLPLMWRDKWWRMFDRDPIMNWVHGRIALLGDAAHPPLQYMAQGAIMAIEDGWVLASMWTPAAERPGRGPGLGRRARRLRRRPARALPARPHDRPCLGRAVASRRRQATAAQRDPAGAGHLRLLVRRVDLRPHGPDPRRGAGHVPGRPARLDRRHRQRRLGLGLMPAIDMHAHAMPMPVLEWLATQGLADLSDVDRSAAAGVVRLDPRISGVAPGTQLPLARSQWDVAARLAEMDAQGVSHHAVSLPPFLMASTCPDEELIEEVVRRGNDALAEYVGEAPDRLVGLGTAPVGLECVAQEASRALALGMAGVAIGTRGAGRELDDPVNEDAVVAARRAAGRRLPPSERGAGPSSHRRLLPAPAAGLPDGDGDRGRPSGLLRRARATRLPVVPGPRRRLPPGPAREAGPGLGAQGRRPQHPAAAERLHPRPLLRHGGVLRGDPRRARPGVRFGSRRHRHRLPLRPGRPRPAREHCGPRSARRRPRTDRDGARLPGCCGSTHDPSTERGSGDLVRHAPLRVRLHPGQ